MEHFLGVNAEETIQMSITKRVHGNIVLLGFYPNSSMQHIIIYFLTSNIFRVKLTHII